MLSNLATSIIHSLDGFSSYRRPDHADTDCNWANLHLRGAHHRWRGQVSQEAGSGEGVKVRREFTWGRGTQKRTCLTQPASLSHW